jgi:hypothetical protein
MLIVRKQQKKISQAVPHTIHALNSILENISGNSKKNIFIVIMQTFVCIK